MGDFVGDWMPIVSGVPQGSVLGPLFFIIYINDLLGLIEISNKVYADDTKLIHAYNNHEECVAIQNALDTITEWTRVWLLFLNPKKCKVLHMGNKKQLSNKFMFSIGDVSVETCLVAKDLGILMNQNLSWSQHINKICTNANYWRKVLYKCFTFRSVEVIKKLYTSIIRPKIEYAAAVWNPISVRCINLLEKVQRRCTKIGRLAKFPYPTRLAMLGLLSFKSRRDRGDLIQMFKYYKSFDNLSLTNAPALSNSVTRGHRFKFIQEQCLHRSRIFFIFNRIASIWNLLPKSAIDAKSVNEFKNIIDDLNIV